MWVTMWVADQGYVRKGILAAVVAGLRKSLAIMEGSPSRYTVTDREGLREAIAYLIGTDWTRIESAR